MHCVTNLGIVTKKIITKRIEKKSEMKQIIKWFFFFLVADKIRGSPIFRLARKAVLNFLLMIHWRLSTILKTNKKMYEVSFLICWDKTQMLRKFPSDKINGTKNALFFLSRAPTHNSFTFNVRFLCDMKHKVCLSKPVCGIFHFRFCFVFIKDYIFV